VRLMRLFVPCEEAFGAVHKAGEDENQTGQG